MKEHISHICDRPVKLDVVRKVKTQLDGVDTDNNRASLLEQFNSNYDKETDINSYKQQHPNLTHKEADMDETLYKCHRVHDNYSK